MSEDFYTKRGRYRIAKIKYYENNQVIEKSFGYQSVENFCKELHKLYIKFTKIDDFLWVEINFWNIKGHKKCYLFQGIFEFYAFYCGILNAGDLVK